MSLKQADKLVKEGNYKAALEAIAEARKLDPNNPYAIAYEERVRTLLHSQHHRNGAKSKGQDTLQEALSTPSLEQISKLAIEQEQSSAAATSVHLNDASARKREEEERLQQEERRKEAITAKVSTLLSRARQYLEQQDFGRSLDEISRALLLDPVNSDAHTLEQKVRGAHEEANKNKELERARRAQAEEQQRQEQLRAELERIQQEQDAQRTREEEARRTAQKQKINQYLQRSRELLGGSRVQEAQNELAFVLVIDPLNAEAATLAKEIHTRQEQIRQQELELRRKREEEEQKKREAMVVAIRNHIENANRLAATGSFSDALRVITRAYVLDPVNEELQECENTLIAGQEEAMRSAEVRRIAEEEQRQRDADEFHRKREQEERDRFLKGSATENENRQRENQERIQTHLVSAQEHLSEQRFEAALSEVALAFLVDPFDDAVKDIEQKVLAARAAANTPADGAPDPESPATPKTVSDQSAVIAGYIAEANRLREQGDYPKALEELGKAFILDPLDESVQRCEEAIQKEFRQSQTEKRNNSSASSPAVQKETSNEHAERAKAFIAAKSFDEALAEIALGLATDPGQQELRALEQSVWKEKSRTGSQGTNGAPEEADDEDSSNLERLINIHLLAADEFVKHGDFTKALDEIAKAFVIDPLNGDVKKMEQRVRQQLLRQQQSPAQPLKLIYRGDKAAEG